MPGEKYYITILEAEYIDRAIKLSLMDDIKKVLPLILNRNIELKNDIIKRFVIMSIREWNNNFSDFPVRKIY